MNKVNEERKQWLKTTSESLQRLSLAINASTMDADAIQQTFHLMESFSLKDFEDARTLMDEKLLQKGTFLESAKAEEHDARLQLSSATADLTKLRSHIAEIVKIRDQLKSSSNDEPKSHVE